jgi:beta-lactamase class A
LAARALTDSDNIALNMLVRRLGSQEILAFCKHLGAPVVSAGEGETSAQSMGVYLRELYRFAQQSKWGQLMVEQMTKSSVKDRIPALLPSTVKVANKHGNYHGVINDAAIVYDKRPYVLVILSRNVPYFDAPAVLAQVSKSIYDVR